MANQRRRLLVVVDNLDRVDARDAVAIWATMRTFFDFDTRGRRPWLGRLWLLVPFDEGSVGKLWAGQTVFPVPDASAAHVNYSSGPSLADVARSFTEKTFQVTFRVAQPVLSTWYDFLVKQLKLAFPAHSEKDFHLVYRIYDLREVVGSRPPTPREIKLFVNGLGALHRQWQDAIPLPVQAFYAILSKRSHDLGSELAITKDEDILRTIPADMLGERWREWLAAMHFNVPIEEALQVSMEGRMQEALSMGDFEKLKPLSEIGGFDHVLEKIAERGGFTSSEMETGRLAMAAAVLSRLPDSPNASRERAWERMCKAAGNTKKWPGLNGLIAEGIVVLANRDPSIEFIGKLVESVKESLPSQGAEPTVAQVNSWLKGTARVITGLRPAYENLIRERFCVPGVPRTYLHVMTSAIEAPETKAICEFLRPQCSPDEVLSVLGGLIKNGEITTAQADATLLLEELYPDWSWGGLVNGPLNERLRATSPLPIPELGPLLSLLVALSACRDEARGVLSSLAADGFVAHHLSYAASDVEVTALCLLPLLSELPEGNLIRQATPQSPAGMQKFNQIVRSTEPDPNVAGLFSNLLIKLKTVDTLFGISRRSANPAPFIKAVLKSISEGSESYTLISPRRILEDRQMLEDACGAKLFESLVYSSVTKGSLIQELIGRDFDSELAPLYTTALKADPSNQAFADFLVKALKTISEDQWVEELSTEEDTISLLLSLMEAGNDPELEVPFEKALVTHAEMLIEGKAEVKRFKKEWPRLLEALGGDLVEATLRRVLQIVYRSENATQAVLEVYGDQLREPRIVATEGERIIFEGAPHFLERSIVAELEWFYTLLEHNSSIIAASSKGTKGEFKGWLKDAMKQENIDKEVLELLRRIADLAGN